VDDPIDRHTLTVKTEHLSGLSFLLGNRGGFVLYLPVANSERDATLQGSKWYGASGFGQAFLEAFVPWIEINGQTVTLDRTVQTKFIMRLDEAVRVYRVAGQEVRERYFVPNGAQAVVVSLDGDCTFSVRPELDMRYYQSLNDDCRSYQSELVDNTVVVRNHITGVGPLHQDMDFVGVLGTLEACTVEMVPRDQRSIHKTYLKDEAREKAIESVYSETGQRVPDEAPVWNQYSTQVYAPACFRTTGPMTLICAFGDTQDQVRACFQEVKAGLESMRTTKRKLVARDLSEGALETGRKDVDDAYAHVLTRFNDCLVARDVDLRGSGTQQEHFYGVFAGNKYFMDAWKRDENISLQALLVTNDYETVRAILDSTWQFQDQRTGRLPHIIRAGEPLVYYSSDGTLWALHRLAEYTRQSGDTDLLREKLPMVQHFFRASMDFVQRGLLPSGGIIDPKYRWETWEDTPFTPRDGYPVEIELLWLTVLDELADSIEDQSLAGQMRSALQEGQHTFEQFYGDGYLFDSLSYDWTPRKVLTPNGYIAFALQYPLPAELERSMVVLARDQLAGRRGVRSLAPLDWPAVFPQAFLEDPRSHTGKNMASFGIYNYHRGIEWEWLNSCFVAGELKHGIVQRAYDKYTRGQVDGALHEGGIGGESELYDEHGQLGADFQAWSMAALIDSLHLYAGITVDAITRTIRLAPWIPEAWPYLSLRRRVGGLRFDLRYERSGPRNHQFELRPVDKVADSHTTTIGLRLDRERRVQTSVCNGAEIPAGEWTYDAGDCHGSGKRAWLSLPFRDSIDLRVTTD
jgi:glycogen debranching enzyme